MAIAVVVLPMGLSTGGHAEAFGCLHGGNPNYEPDFEVDGSVSVELRAPRLNKRSIYYEVCGPDTA